MLNTPIGQRNPFDSECRVIQCAAYKLYRHILSTMTKDDEMTITPVKESSAFHGLHPQAQIYLLSNTLQLYFDQLNPHIITQFNNSAMECVYSCMLYEISVEITDSLNNVKRQKQHMRSYAYHSLVEVEDRDFAKKMAPSNQNLKDWIGAIDKLAAKTVYDPNFAKGFEAGYLPELTPKLIQEAEGYLDSFSFLIRE